MGALPKDRQIGLLTNLPRLTCQRMIHEGRYDEHDYEAVYDLYMHAYGDEQLAREKRLEAMWRLIKTETEVARRMSRG